MVLPSTVPTAASADLAAITKSRSSKRPRAFGRTSNVWQYVDSVHNRMSPTTAVAARRTTLDTSVLAEEEEEEVEADDVPNAKASGPSPSHRHSTTSSSAAHRVSRSLATEPPHRASLSSTDASTPPQQIGPSLRSVKSLTELPSSSKRGSILGSLSGSNNGPPPFSRDERRCQTREHDQRS
ncbi:hypothetical protein PINS_up005243 [Pythium insidiosum]|nr:hypothetical protein PINS_up005243 [Pythium insidiosum]